MSIERLPQGLVCDGAVRAFQIAYDGRDVVAVVVALRANKIKRETSRQKTAGDAERGTERKMQKAASMQDTSSTFHCLVAKSINAAAALGAFG